MTNPLIKSLAQTYRTLARWADEGDSATLAAALEALASRLHQLSSDDLYYLAVGRLDAAQALENLTGDEPEMDDLVHALHQACDWSMAPTR